MDSDELKKRTNSFAHRCVKLSVSLPRNFLANHIKTQLIRCATSVAANYRSACIAHSKAAFVSKLSITIEEIDESCFWIEFMIDEDLMKKQKVMPLLNEAREITAILVSSRKTARNAHSKTIENSKLKISTVPLT